jgi:hypothetical protein
VSIWPWSRDKPRNLLRIEGESGRRYIDFDAVENIDVIDEGEGEVRLKLKHPGGNASFSVMREDAEELIELWRSKKSVSGILLCEE